jgi:regulation of enolase protein 1 (concanavalin A-like superfamily)
MQGVYQWLYTQCAVVLSYLPVRSWLQVSVCLTRNCQYGPIVSAYPVQDVGCVAMLLGQAHHQCVVSRAASGTKDHRPESYRMQALKAQSCQDLAVP